MYTREAMAIRSKIVGVLLRNARIRAGKSRKDCAAVLGCSPDTISQFEYGRKDITLPQLEVLAYFLGLPITYFWDKDAIPEEEEMDRSVDEIMTIRRKIIGVLLRQARLDAHVDGGHGRDVHQGLGQRAGHLAAALQGREEIGEHLRRRAGQRPGHGHADGRGVLVALTGQVEHLVGQVGPRGPGRADHLVAELEHQRNRPRQHPAGAERAGHFYYTILKEKTNDSTK